MANKTRKIRKTRKSRVGKKKGGSNQLTVGELREALEGVPDNATVWCVSYPSGYKSYGADYDAKDNEFNIDFNG